jgi:diguanylate cyclase (GGDEF)-like protein
MPRKPASTTGIRFVATFIGSFLIFLSLLVIGTRRNAVDKRIERKLASASADEAQTISGEFVAARSTALLLSRNSAFSDYAEADFVSRNRSLTPSEKEAVAKNRKHSEDALSYLESLYVGRIGEACLINDRGVELARSVNGKIAPTDELSETESETNFFRPTFSRRVGETYHSAPYHSPDTNSWVIAHSSMLPFTRNARAFVHFELTLQTLADRLHAKALSEQIDLQILDRQTGDVVIDDNGNVYPFLDLKSGLRTVKPQPEYQWLLQDKDEVGGTTKGKTRYFVASPSADPNNENDWIIVASAPIETSPFRSLSGTPMWLAMAGIAALLVGAFASRLYIRYLLRAANSDPLTGLANRRKMTDTLAALRESNDLYGAVIIDLDRFKEVNDVYGHEVGDELLVAVGKRLFEQLPSSDLVCRLGGDEFAVLLQTRKTAEELLEQVRSIHSQLLAPYCVGSLRLDLEASVGLAIGSTMELSGAELLHRADQAMFTAKQLRLGVEVFRLGHESAGQRQLVLLGELRSAIELHELVVFFQPKMSFADGEIHSMEALVRWQHPTKGLLQPSAFIEFAEQTSLIRPLTLEVIELTLQQIRKWLDKGDEIKVSVNISTRSLLDDQLIPELLDLLERYECPASMLQFEITESTIMHDPEQALNMVGKIQQLGIEISIDDFGTGYSSLAYLTNLCAQELKIDRAFVSRMTRDPASASIVSSIIALGHTLGMRVVAEGVEDHETARALRVAGCDIGQGFLWSKPVPAASALDVRIDRIDNLSLISQ